MTTIYTGVYKCLRTDPAGMVGYNDIVLGLEGSNRLSVMVRGTCARFEVGKEYLISVAETGL